MELKQQKKISRLAISGCETTGVMAKVIVAMLPQGLYYVTLRGENGSVVKKFVKQ